MFSNDLVVIFENNTNYCSINGGFSKGTVNSAGIVGHISSVANISFYGNTNYGDICSSEQNVSDGVMYFAGIIGLFTASNKHDLIMIDNSNYGSLRGPTRSVVCGLLCIPDNCSSPPRVVVRNFVNKGTLEGQIVLGLAHNVTMANNVVSMGVMKSTEKSLLFWENSANTSFVYGLEGACENCDYNDVTVFKMNSTDERYHSTDGTEEVISEALNREARKNGYTWEWDESLTLRRPIFIHIGGSVGLQNIRVLCGLPLEESGFPAALFEYHLIPEGADLSRSMEYKRTTIPEYEIVLLPYHEVIVTGELSRDVFIPVDNEKHILSESLKDLKKYLNDVAFVVGDSEKNKVLSGEEQISSDMTIVVMRRNIVVIDMKDEVHKDEVNVTEFAESLSQLTGIEAAKMIVELECDEEGFVLRVLVMVPELSHCEKVVESVNGLKKDGQCSFGILCRCGGARLFVEEENLSAGCRCEVERSVNSFVIAILLMMIMSK